MNKEEVTFPGGGPSGIPGKAVNPMDDRIGSSWRASSNNMLPDMPSRCVRLFPYVRFTILLSIGCLCPACQVNPFSIPVDVVTSRMAQQQLQQWEPKVLGAPLSVADERIGRRNDTLEPLDGSNPWVIYDLPENPGGESFLVVRLTPDGRVGQIGVWKRDRDGLLDLWLARRFRTVCLSRDEAACLSRTKLDPPTRVFRSQATQLEARFHEVRTTHPTIPPKYVILCFDDRRRCVDVRIVGIVAQGREHFGPLFWPVPVNPFHFPVPSWFPRIPFVQPSR